MLVKVILPQALRSMTPAWMNLYCTMTMATSLANLLGINDLMTVMQEQLAAQAQPDLLLPAYGLVFLIYFVYIYPLSRYSRWLEKRWSIYG
jgi:ABC-type amino acid transport system permease subunit